MKNIVTMIYGSRAFGTSTPQSDTDVKSVFILDSKSILLQKVKDVFSFEEKPIINPNKKFNPKEESKVDVIETEEYSLQKFLNLACQGQTIAIDMLFIRDLRSTSDTWDYIVENREKIVSKNLSGFVGFAKAQAKKYFVKIDRVLLIEDLLKVLSSASENKREILSSVLEFLCSQQNVFTEGKASIFLDGRGNRYLECCNKMVPLGATIYEAIQIYSKLLNEYWSRSIQASHSGGDWKSLIHAVRVASEAIELLKTSHLTFPRPEAELLINIRDRKIPFNNVLEIIENLILEIEELKKSSSLRDEPDYQFCEDLVLSEHKKAIKEFSYE